MFNLNIEPHKTNNLVFHFNHNIFIISIQRIDHYVISYSKNLIFRLFKLIVLDINTYNLYLHYFWSSQVCL